MKIVLVLSLLLWSVGCSDSTVKAEFYQDPTNHFEEFKHWKECVGQARLAQTMGLSEEQIKQIFVECWCSQKVCEA